MTTNEIQNALLEIVRNLIDARETIEVDADENDDDGMLADIARDLTENIEGITSADSFADAQLLTTDAGIVLRTQDGSEFQITIVQRR